MTTGTTVKRESDRTNWAEGIAPQLEHAKEGLNQFNNSVVSFIKENPGTCLLGALAFGFLVGKLASRR